MSILDRALRMGEAKKLKGYEDRVARIGAFEPEMERLEDEELRGHADELRERARNGESLDSLLYASFALTREAARRTLGQRHFDVQLIGGMVLHDGGIAEMRTGEGKTLTATLPVVLNSLGGEGIHLVTVNDYLARRDAEWMGPIYEALGLRTGVLQDMQPYPDKQAAYAADVTYGTHSEFGFDYLRDNMARSLDETVQHGGRQDTGGKRRTRHVYAIVDDVDMALIYDASTPLVLSADGSVHGQEEGQWLAGITLQNYFRLYGKLAGMTGAASIASRELKEVFDLEVVGIPANRPVVREDSDDRAFRSEEGKWDAVVREIGERNARGQPVLVGTVSVEVSALVSQKLRQRGIEHTVLDAEPENVERKGDIVAEAGRSGAVTVATSAAVHGIDIELGGHPQRLAQIELARLGLQPGDPGCAETAARILSTMKEQAEADRNEVMEAGGLFVCGAEHHETRRVDDHLRGRAGRQGDPGETRFFLGRDNELVHRFADNRLYEAFDRGGGTNEEGSEEPLEARALGRHIDRAQKRAEEEISLIRKRTLEYDDAIDEQRRRIYAYRDELLEGRDIGEPREWVGAMIEGLVAGYTPGRYTGDWDLDGLVGEVSKIWPTGMTAVDLNLASVDREGLVTMLADEALTLYARREAELGAEVIRALERYLLIDCIDERWREHIGLPDRPPEEILMPTIWADLYHVILAVEVDFEEEDDGGLQRYGSPRPYAPPGASTLGGRISLRPSVDGEPVVRSVRRPKES